MSSNKPKRLKDLESLTNGIGRALTNFRKYCIKSGMEDITINALMEGKSVIECHYCETLNMYEVSHNKRDKWRMYQCGNEECYRTWLQFDKDLDE